VLWCVGLLDDENAVMHLHYLGQRNAIERSRAALRLDSEMRALRNCYESLTPREREVMALVASGLLNKQVGGELGGH
jgi:FixJ family two-component response regulator